MKQGNQKVKTQRELDEKVKRIALSKKSTEIISKSIEYMLEAHPGVEISEKGFVNWVIEKCFRKVTPSHEKQLVEEFYDELKFLENSVKALKKKRRLGEDVSDDPILSQIKPLLKKKKQKVKSEVKKTPAIEKPEITNPPQTAPNEAL